MPRSAKNVSPECVAVLVIAFAMALLAGCDGKTGIVAGDQDTAIDFGETDTTKQLDVQNTSDQNATCELLVKYGDGPKDWLTYGPIMAECGPAQSVVFTLEADRSVLPAGLWEAEVVVTSGAIRKSVMISIAVVAAAASIDTHNFGTSSEPLEFAVWNAGGGTLQYEVAEAPAWLTVENGTGTSTGPADRKTVTLSPNRSGLKPGTYSDQVVIIPVNGLSTFRKTIDVTMTVLPPGVPALTIQATPTSGDAPLEVQFKAMNGSVLADNPTAGHTIKWGIRDITDNVGEDGDDTTVGQENQVSYNFAKSGTFLVTLSLVGALGTFNCHQATITVNSDPAQPGALVVTPTDDAIFSGPPGGPYTSVNGVTSYNLKNVGGKSISWTAGADAPSWVSLSKGSGTVAPGITDSAPVTVNSNADPLPAGNYSGSVDFTTTSGTKITTRKVSLKITPIANDDSYSINEDKPLNVMAVAGVLANDPGHGQLPAKRASDPSYGSVTLNPNGSFSYSPKANFNGSDSFSYKLSDETLSSNIATVSITVKPVNDPPTIDVPIPPPPITGVNGTIKVPMTVSPGPADEASQKVTVTVISSNQAVVRDTDLRFDGSQLTITAIGTGSATITVTATDDGGMANGGLDTSPPLTLPVRVFDGVPISGTVSLVDTVGARPKFGQHGLKFTGTGASASQNYTTLTDVNGHYTQPVPEGWTGTITAQDPSRMVFLDPVTKTGYDQNGQDVSIWKITTPVAQPGLASQDIVAWTAPIGIPGPEFGIREAPPTYNASNPLHYYVDNTVAGATDTANTQGSPAKPRVTIPRNLTAGAYVEVHGGPYSYGSAGYIQITGQGTASSPVFIVGVGMPRFSQKLSVYHPTSENRYIICQGLDLFKWECVAPASHVVLRRCTIRGNASNGGATVAGYSDLYACDNVVLHSNTIRDNGDWQADFDQDVHGITVATRCNTIWILDNEMYHNSGDGLQINAGTVLMPTTHHLYVGRNLSHENKQSGLWTKQAVDVIFSQNECHTLRPRGTNPSAPGPGLGFQYGPERVWFLYNHVYNCCYGIESGSTSGMGTGQFCYLIGNLIHDIHHDPGYNYNPITSWSNAGIMLGSTINKYVVNNTIYNVDAGINSPSGDPLYMRGNIISNVTDPQGNHIYLETAGAQTSSVMENCLLWQNGSPVRIKWGPGVQDLRAFQTASGKGANCIAADPLFANPTAGDFHLLAGSPGIDTGATPDVYATFEALYGISIRVDYDGASRPVGIGQDIGAFEY